MSLKGFCEGTQVVYIYYLPSYKTLAEHEGKNVWPCKIGSTDQDSIIRILSQLSTAFPEKPSIDLILQTDESRALESALHLALSSRNKKVNSAPGEEWFLTNPGEVESIATFTCPDLIKRETDSHLDIQCLLNWHLHLNTKVFYICVFDYHWQ